MQVMGEENLNQVNTGKGEQVVEIRKNAVGRHAPLLSARAGAVGIDVGGSHGARMISGEVFESMQVRYPARTDKTHS